MLESSKQQKAEKTQSGEQLHRLSRLRFYGDQFVFDTHSGMFYRLSLTAGFLLRAIDAGATVDQLPGLLQQECGINEKRAVRDVELFINDLSGLGVFEEPDATGPDKETGE